MILRVEAADIQNIIHVERMLWQFQAAVPKHFHTVNDRVHQDILSQAEASCTVPVDELRFGSAML